MVPWLLENCTLDSEVFWRLPTASELAAKRVLEAAGVGWMVGDDVSW